MIYDAYPTTIESSPPDHAFPNNLPRRDTGTFEITGLYQPQYERLWSAYPDSPASIVARRASTTFLQGLEVAPLIAPLTVAPEELVTIELRPLFGFHNSDGRIDRVVRFETVAVRTQLDTAAARAVAEGFHRQFHSSVQQAVVLQRGAPAPSFDLSRPLRIVYDAADRSLHFTALASDRTRVILTADYVLLPPYSRIDSIRVSADYFGE